MQRSALSICSQSHLSFSRTAHPKIWLNSIQHVTRRFRSGGDNPNNFQKPKGGFVNTWSADGKRHSPTSGYKQFNKRPAAKTQITASSENVPTFLRVRVSDWSRMPNLVRRLEAFGIPSEDVHPLLQAFVSDVQDGLLEQPRSQEQYTLDRFSGNYSSSYHGRIDEVLTNIFYSWASDPLHQHFLETIVPSTTLQQINELHTAAILAYPAEDYPEARRIKRKFIMHVGPTNSGKTHMALRALAAASSGVYAGPLRLLAHEVWERLNQGQIVPLGMEPEPDTEPDTDTNFDADIIAAGGEVQHIVRKQGSERYVKQCNLLTGEESRIVGDHAPLLSCTIEMISTARFFEVAVIDEIQMISDSDRGGAWTEAVLGIFAKEIHLCGEETAVPVIEALLKQTGDELVINRYERLSPLNIQEQSLGGDLKGVQKGDCVVAFSRSGIFALKRQVEELTGMRCAVAYGRLPPEIRSEQAALFNDPESGYDVMVGSDAIGMGLNLKIKRIVFEAVHKFNGHEEVQLSVSQIKQIAGRAGRFGLHGEPGGFVTTLHKKDIPILRKALDTAMQPLDRAYIRQSGRQTENVVRALPPRSPSITIFDTYTYISRVHWPYHYSTINNISDICEFIDSRVGDFTLEDKTQLMVAPISWRDSVVVDIAAIMFRQYRNHMRVHLVESLKGPLLTHLEDVEFRMLHGAPRSSNQTLMSLESLHKILVFYMWMQMRSPVAWSDYAEVTELKKRTELALDWSLQGVSWGRSRKLPGIETLRERKQDDEKIDFLDRETVRKRKESRADRFVSSVQKRMG